MVTNPKHIKYSDTLKYDPGHIQVHPGLYGQKLFPKQIPYGRENACKADGSTVCLRTDLRKVCDQINNLALSLGARDPEPQTNYEV